MKENKLSKELTKKFNGTLTYAIVGILMLTLTMAFIANNQTVFAAYTLAFLFIQTIWVLQLKHQKKTTRKKYVILEFMLHIATWFPIWLLFLLSLTLQSTTPNSILSAGLGLLAISSFAYHVWRAKDKLKTTITYNVFRPTLNYAYIAILTGLLYLVFFLPDIIIL